MVRLMIFLSPLAVSAFPFFFPFRSRPLIGGAGIAGNPASPVSGVFGNRGKDKTAPLWSEGGIEALKKEISQ